MQLPTGFCLDRGSEILFVVECKSETGAPICLFDTSKLLKRYQNSFEMAVGMGSNLILHFYSSTHSQMMKEMRVTETRAYKMPHFLRIR